MPAVVRDDIIFVHIPKASGTSISNWFGNGEQFIGHPKLETLLDMVSGKPFTFTVVRNPWDRAVSAYHYLFHTQKDTNFQEYIDKGVPTFDEFIKNLKTVKVDEVWFDGTTQQGEWFKSGVDLVIKFENLNEEFKVIQDMLGDHRPLPHCNKSEHGNYRDYFTDETRDIIEKLFIHDIHTFKYSF
jgi:hypothetical protein